jgi:hypothetical protein
MKARTEPCIVTFLPPEIAYAKNMGRLQKRKHSPTVDTSTLEPDLRVYTQLKKIEKILKNASKMLQELFRA